jgi:hypothetical protein
VTPVFETNEAVVSVLPPTVEEVKVAEPTEAVVEGAVPAEGAEAKEKEAGKETKETKGS